MPEKETKKQKQFKKQATKVLSIVSISIIAVQIIAGVSFYLGYQTSELHSKNTQAIQASAVEEYKASLKN